MNLYERFELNVGEHPHKPAFIYFDERNWVTLTYQNIFDETQRFISRLEAGPLTPGMTAALMSRPNADFFPFALALLKFGIVPILLEPAIGIKKIGEIFQESKPDIFIGNTLTHALRILFGWGRESVKDNLTIQKVASQRSKVVHPVPNSQFTDLPITNSAAIIYTSGSTGLPKGAIYTQENLSAQLE